MMYNWKFLPPFRSSSSSSKHTSVIFYQHINTLIFVSNIFFPLLCMWIENMSATFQMKLNHEITWSWNQKKLISRWSDLVNTLSLMSQYRPWITIKFDVMSCLYESHVFMKFFKNLMENLRKSYHVTKISPHFALFAKLI